MSDAPPDYLQPYLTATRRHGGGFGSLLWASPTTQSKRFDAFTRLGELKEKLVLDVGCGRADFLDHLIKRDLTPGHYVGIEAVPELAIAAEAKGHANSMIVRADFVTDPQRMLVGADVVVISGSLNTLDERAFYRTVQIAFEAATEQLIFNFLSSPGLANSDFLHWYRPGELVKFARTLTPRVKKLDDYLHGDCTLSLKKPVATDSSPNQITA